MCLLSKFFQQYYVIMSNEEEGLAYSKENLYSQYLDVSAIFLYFSFFNCGNSGQWQSESLRGVTSLMNSGHVYVCCSIDQFSWFDK